MQNSISLSLDREKTVKRSKHAVVVWLAAALAPSRPRPSAKRTQNEILKKGQTLLQGDELAEKTDRLYEMTEFLTREQHSLSSLKTESGYLKPLDSIYIAFSTCHRQLLWNLTDGTVRRLTERAPWISLNRRFVVSGHTAKGNNWFGFSFVSEEWCGFNWK